MKKKKERKTTILSSHIISKRGVREKVLRERAEQSIGRQVDRVEQRSVLGSDTRKEVGRFHRANDLIRALHVRPQEFTRATDSTVEAEGGGVTSADHVLEGDLAQGVSEVGGARRPALKGLPLASDIGDTMANH